MRVSLLSFLVVRYNFKTSKSPSCPDGAESHGKKRSSSEHSPPQPTPQANQSRLPHLHHTHSLTHTHTHTPPTEIQKVCATLRAPGAQICSGGCCFSAVITLLSISTERKARGRKVKSRRRKKAWSVEGNNAEEKAQISGTSKTARGLRTGNKQAPFTLVVPQLDLGGLLVSRFAFLPLFLSVFSACRGEPR